MRLVPKLSLRVALPFGLAISAGIFLTVAGHALHWSDTTIFVVGAALAAMLGLLGVPLALLPLALAGDVTRSTRHAPEAVDSWSGTRLPYADRVANPYKSGTAALLQSLDRNPSGTSLRDLMLLPPHTAAPNITLSPMSVASGETNAVSVLLLPIRENGHEVILNPRGYDVRLPELTSAN